MPLYIPGTVSVATTSQKEIAQLSAEEVWSYVTRLLTSLSDPNDIVKFLGKGTGTEVPNNKSLYDLLALENPLILYAERETEWQTDPVVENVASAVATALTAGSITPTYPTGSVERRAILLPMIKASNQASNTHHIGLKIQYRTGGAGPYSDLKDYTANPPLTLATVDGATDSWAQPIDVTAIVSTGVQVEFRFEVDSDNAGSVNYTTSFLLALVYRMG